MKRSRLYVLLSALLLSAAFSVAYSQVDKQRDMPDELFI
jgi:hypothetical protein